MTYDSQQFNTIDWLAFALLIVGAINWGMIGFFNFDLVAFMFGPLTILARVFYALIGLSALYTLYISAKPADIIEPRLA